MDEDFEDIDCSTVVDRAIHLCSVEIRGCFVLTACCWILRDSSAYHTGDPARVTCLECLEHERKRKAGEEEARIGREREREYEADAKWTSQAAARIRQKFGLGEDKANRAAGSARFLARGRGLTPDEEAALIDRIGAAVAYPLPLTPEEREAMAARGAADMAAALAQIGPGNRQEAVAEALAEADIQQQLKRTALTEKLTKH